MYDKTQKTNRRLRLCHFLYSIRPPHFFFKALSQYDSAAQEVAVVISTLQNIFFFSHITKCVLLILKPRHEAPLQTAHTYTFWPTTGLFHLIWFLLDGQSPVAVFCLLLCFATSHFSFPSYSFLPTWHIPPSDRSEAQSRPETSVLKKWGLPTPSKQDCDERACSLAQRLDARQHHASLR